MHVRLYFFLFFLICSFCLNAQKNSPNLYKGVLQIELGPQLMREEAWDKLILMEATNEFFNQNRQATIHDYREKFSPLLDHFKNPRDLSEPLKLGAEIGTDFLPLPPGAGPLLDRWVDGLITHHAESLNHMTAIDFPPVGVFQATRILQEGEQCINSKKSCMQAYDEILEATGLSHNVASLRDGAWAKRIPGVDSALSVHVNKEDLPLEALRLHQKINERRRKTKSKEAALTTAEAEEVTKLNARHIEQLNQKGSGHLADSRSIEGQKVSAEELARKHRERIGDIRAANYLFTTALGFIDPVAADKTARVAEGYTQIIDVLGRKDLTQLVVAASLTQGAFLIASVLASGNSSSFEQSTLAALQEIQKQISQLRIEVHRGFQGLNFKLDQMYSDLAGAIESVKGTGTDLQRSAELLQVATSVISENINQARIDSASGFRALLDVQLSAHKPCFNGASIKPTEFISCRDALAKLTTKGAGESLYVSLVDPALNQTVDWKELRKPTTELGGVLLRYGNKALGGAQRDIWFPHLGVWMKYVSTYLSVLEKFPQYTKVQREDIRKELRAIQDSGNRASSEIAHLGKDAENLFILLRQNYDSAAQRFVDEVNRNYIRAIRVRNEGGHNQDVALTGQKYFADHLEGADLVPAFYNLFGSTEQVRANYDKMPKNHPLHLCPGHSSALWHNNEYFRPKSIAEVAAYPKPFLSLYPPGQVEGGTAPIMPDELVTRVPGVVRMLSDLTNRSIGFCMSDVNWLVDAPADCPPRHGGIAGDLREAGVNLQVVIDVYLKGWSGEYLQENVFEQIVLDSRGLPPQRPVFSPSTYYGISVYSSCGGDGHRLIHVMHQVLYGNGAPTPMPDMLRRIGTTSASYHPNATNLDRMRKEVSVLLKDRRYYMALGLLDLLSKNSSDELVFEGGNYRELISRFDELRSAHLLLSKFASFLLPNSYSHDKFGIYESISLLDPEGFIELLNEVVRGYQCDVAREKGGSEAQCSVRAQNTASGPVNFIDGFPLITRRTTVSGVTENVSDSSQDRVFEFERSTLLAEKALERIISVLKKNEATTGMYVEQFVPFEVVRKAVEMKQNEN